MLIGNTKLVLKDSHDILIWTVDNVNDDATILDTNGNEIIELTTIDSAVNHIGIVNATTGNSPIVRAEGEADTGITFDNRDGEEILILDSIASSVNEITIKSAITNVNPSLECTGEANTGITFANSEQEEILILDSIATSVNELTIKSAITGANPSISATGEADTGITFFNDQSEELLILDSIATAVNHFTIKNSAANNAVELLAIGDDTNISMTFIAQGTGVYNFSGTSTTSTNISLYENTANGTNAIGIKAPASIASNRTITLTDEDITLSVSTQAEMETGTSLTDFVTPGRMQNHPGVAKFWVHIDETGTPSVTNSHNVAGITDTATGRIQIGITTDFSSVAYSIAGTAGDDDAAGVALFVYLDGAQAAGSVDVAIETDAGALTDADYVSVIGFGDQ